MIFTARSTLIEAVINHPSVRPTVQAGDHRLYSHDLLASGAVALADLEGRLALFVPAAEPLTHEGHIFCLAGTRGAGAVAFGKAAVDRLFDVYSSKRLIAAVPMVLPAARLYCRRLGLRSIGRDLFDEHFELEAVTWAA